MTPSWGVRGRVAVSTACAGHMAVLKVKLTYRCWCMGAPKSKSVSREKMKTSQKVSSCLFLAPNSLLTTSSIAMLAVDVFLSFLSSPLFCVASGPLKAINCITGLPKVCTDLLNEMWSGEKWQILVVNAKLSAGWTGRGSPPSPHLFPRPPLSLRCVLAHPSRPARFSVAASTRSVNPTTTGRLEAAGRPACLPSSNRPIVRASPALEL